MQHGQPSSYLLEQSRALAVRFRTLSDSNDREQVLDEMKNTIRATLKTHTTEALDWGAAIEADKHISLELALEEFACAQLLLDPPALTTIIRQQDWRTTPILLRIACHRALWQLDDKEAYSRARNLMFREQPRANDTLRPIYLEKLLVDIKGSLVNELLLSIAAEESMESRARSLAIEYLVSRQVSDISPILESIFDTEATNFLLRKQALLAILKLDEPRGRGILINKIPQRSADLGMFTFMSSLRQQYSIK